MGSLFRTAQGTSLKWRWNILMHFFIYFRERVLRFSFVSDFCLLFSFPAAACKDVPSWFPLPSLLWRWSRGWGCGSASRSHRHSRCCCNSAVDWSKGWVACLVRSHSWGPSCNSRCKEGRKTTFAVLCRLKNSFLYSLDQNSTRASLESLHKCHSCHSAEFFNNNTVMNRTVTNPYVFSGAKIENWQGNKCSFQTSEGALQAVGSKQQYYRLITMLLEDSFKVINMFLLSLFPHFGSSAFACRYNFICRVWLWGCSWNIWGLYRWEGLDM